MVRLSDLIPLFTLYPELHVRAQENGHFFGPESVVLQDRSAKDIPVYATNLRRLHHTVIRARQVIESRDTSVPVSATELQGILTQIEGLEAKVKAWIQQGDSSSATSPAPGLASGPPTSSKAQGSGGSNDADCDAENLLYDLGARAAVDENGQVSGHPLFRKNANCPMQSAVNGKKAPDAAVAPPLPPAKASNPAAAASAPAPAVDAPVNAPVNTPVEAPVNAPVTTPTGAVVANKDVSPAVPQNRLAESSSSSSPASPSSSSTTQASADAPQVISIVGQFLGVATLPINGKYVTTTVTMTTTSLSTVTAPRQAKSSHSSDGKVPMAPSASAFKGFTNTTAPQFPNGTANYAGSSAKFDGTVSRVATSATKISITTTETKVSFPGGQKVSNATSVVMSFNSTSSKTVANKPQANIAPAKLNDEASKGMDHPNTSNVTLVDAASHPHTAEKTVNSTSPNALGHAPAADKMANLTAPNTASHPPIPDKVGNKTSPNAVSRPPTMEQKTNLTAPNAVSRPPATQQKANLTASNAGGRPPATDKTANTPHPETANVTSADAASHSPAAEKTVNTTSPNAVSHVPAAEKMANLTSPVVPTRPPAAGKKAENTHTGTANVTSAGPAGHAPAADKTVNTAHPDSANVTSANKASHAPAADKMANTAQPGPVNVTSAAPASRPPVAEKLADAARPQTENVTAADSNKKAASAPSDVKSFNSTSSQAAAVPDTSAAKEPSAKVHIINVIPLPAKTGQQTSSAATAAAPVPSSVTDKAKESEDAAVPNAKATASGPPTGFKTVLVPGYERSVRT